MSNTIVSNFGNYNPIDPSIIAYVNAAIQTANADSVQASPPSVINGIAQYVDGTGKLIKSTPYTMPDTLGVAGEVLTVDAGGNIVYGSNVGPNPFDQDLNTFNDVSFNSVTTANITGPTKVSVAGVDRLDITATETNLFSQNVGTGPAGTQLRLRNDNTFVLGTRFSNNGVIECNPNSMAIYGSEVKSAEILTNSSITKQLTNGTFRIDREIMTTTGQEFRDGNGFNRLNITNSDGVTINSAFSLPTTTGSVGDVLTRTGTSATTWSAPPTAPTYLPTLNVTALSQGPSALSTNYTLPQYPPPIDSILSNDGTQGFVVNIPININCQFFATYSNPLRLSTINIPILAGDYIPDDLTDIISVALRDNITSNNVIANIFIGFDPLIQRYGMRLSPGSVDLTSMIWQIYVNGTNDNNVFGLTTGNATVNPATPGIVYGPDAPLYLNATGYLVWRNVVKNQIESDNGNAVIECSELNGIISYGDYNLNNGSLNNCGNINALDNCNITTATTQISNGLGEIKLTADSVDRVIIDDTTTTLNSKNATTGPSGSYLNLNNDSSFSLGSYFANNGVIDCTTNSMALVGPQATSAVVLTDLNIITSLGVGGRIDREILDTTSQSFRDPTGTERLKIDSDITINNAYTLPTTAGVDGEVLTRTTGTATTWNRPQVYSIFSQIVDQTVVSTAAETTIIGGGTPTSTLTVPPNFFTAGMAFRYTTGGLFRTSANNISARFRLRNSGILFDSGLLVFSNRVIPATPWNVEATFAYMGGTVMVTNFNFQYNAGNDGRGFTSQQSNNTFNATVSNTLNFTITWSVASADNTITTNFGVVQKIY